MRREEFVEGRKGRGGRGERKKTSVKKNGEEMTEKLYEAMKGYERELEEEGGRRKRKNGTKNEDEIEGDI